MADTLTRSDIEDIMSLVEQSSFDQLTLEMGDLKISLVRRGATGDAAPNPPIETPPDTQVAAIAATPPVAAPPAEVSGGEGLIDICSEMLGTFYHAPKPGADSFVTVGSKVTPDTVIGIIEVMKLMTSVESGISGTVAEIVAPDGELVEHGQVLVRVRQD